MGDHGGGWIRSGGLSVLAPGGFIDLGDIIDGSNCALRQIAVRSSLRSTEVLFFSVQDALLPQLVSIQLTNPNLGIAMEQHLSVFNTQGNLYDGPICNLTSKEEKKLVLVVHPMGTSSRGSGLKRFNAITWRSTLVFRLGLDSLSVALTSRFCRSMLAFDAKEVSFDCALGKADVKEVTIQNYSEIATKFSLKIGSGLNSCFTFIDYETGLPLLARHPIQGSSNLRIKVHFHSNHLSLGDNVQELVLENLLDSRNTDRIPVYAAVSAETRESGLDITPESIDFGDCFSGETVVRSLLLKNLTQMPLEVFMSSSASSPETLSFLLEEDARSATADVSKSIQTFPVSQPGSEDESDDFNIPLGGSATSLSGSLSRVGSLSRLQFASGHLRKPSAAFGNAIDQEQSPLSMKDVISELLILPGKERQVRLLFNSASTLNQSDAIAGSFETASGDEVIGDRSDRTRLKSVKFRVSFNCRGASVQSSIHGKHSRSIRCTARVCTSQTTVSTSIINFGEIAIASPAVASFTVQNLSDLPTSVMLQFESKVLSVNKNPVELGPRSSQEVRLKLVPQRRTSSYQKEVQLFNMHNHSDFHSVVVFSKNFDPADAGRHSVYDIDVGNGCGTSRLDTPIIDFGKLMLNFPAAKLFTLVNKTSSILTINCKVSSLEDLAVYRSSQAQVVDEDDTCLDLGSLVSHELVDIPTWSSGERNQLLAVQEEIQRLQNFRRAVQDKLVTPAEVLVLGPHQSLPLLLVYCLEAIIHPYIRGKLKNMPATLTLQLASKSDSDSAIVAPLENQIINVQAMVCHAKMHFSLKHINFGVLQNLARHHFGLVVSNISDVSLQYCIIKTRSIASDDIDCPSGYIGVLRPYQIKEIPVVFKPSLAGRFFESLTFQNVQDRHDKQVIYIKADIRKPFNFWLQAIVIDFGYCILGGRSRKRKLLIKNISDRVRRIRVQLETTQSQIGSHILFEAGDLSLGPAVSSVDRDEEREKLENKLRIAERKNQKEKIKKIHRRLSELCRLAASDASFSDADTGQEIENTVSANSLVLTLPPSAVQNVFVTFVSSATDANVEFDDFPSALVACVKGVILVHEEKNKDYVRDVKFSVQICRDSDAYQSILSEMDVFLHTTSNRSISSHCLSAGNPRFSRLRAGNNVPRSVSSSPIRRLVRTQKPSSDDASPAFSAISDSRGLSALNLHVLSRFIFNLDLPHDSHSASWRLFSDDRDILRLSVPRFWSSPYSWQSPEIISWPFIFLLPFALYNPPLSKGLLESEKSSISVSWRCDDPYISEGMIFSICIIENCTALPESFSDAHTYRELTFPGSSQKTETIVFRATDALVIMTKWRNRSGSNFEFPNKTVSGLLLLSSSEISRSVRIAVSLGKSSIIVHPPRLCVNRADQSKLTVANASSCNVSLMVSVNPQHECISFICPVNGCSRTSLSVDILANSKIQLTVIPTLPLSVPNVKSCMAVIRDQTNFQDIYIPIVFALDAPNSMSQIEIQGFLSNPVNEVVELGQGFLDPEDYFFEKVYRLRLHNRQVTGMVSVSIRCNLVRQVQLFDSLTSATPLDTFVVESLQSKQVFVRMRFHVDREQAMQGVCRDIYGCLTFRVDDLSNRCESYKFIKIFHTQIGLPILSVAVRYPDVNVKNRVDSTFLTIDYGMLNTAGALLRGEFSITNPSQLIPFAYQVIPSTSAIHFDADTQLVGTVSCFESLTFSFLIEAKEYGLFQGYIDIKHSQGRTSPIAKICVCFFLDRNDISVLLPKREHYFCLQCDPSYVELKNDPELSLTFITKPSYQFSILNETPERRQLSLTASIRDVPSDGYHIWWGDDRDRTDHGKCLLAPGATVSLHIDLSDTLMVGQRLWETINSGRCVGYTYNVLIHNLPEGDAISCIRLSGVRAVSSGRIDNPVILIGNIGFDNNWQDVPIEFTVINENEIPLHFQTDQSAFPTSMFMSDSEFHSLHVLGSFEQRSFSISLCTRTLACDEDGGFSAELGFINLFNPGNSKMRVLVSGCVRSQPIHLLNLSTDNTISMSPISLHDSSSSVQWFRVQNQSTVFSREMHVDVAADVRYSNIVSIKVITRDLQILKEFVLQFGQIMDVGVRVVSMISSADKVPRIDVGELVIGSISFLAMGFSKPQTIPICASFNLGPRFTLSLQRMRFYIHDVEDNPENLLSQKNRFWVRNLSATLPLVVHLRFRANDNRFINMLTIATDTVELPPDASVSIDVRFSVHIDQLPDIPENPCFIDVFDDADPPLSRSVEILFDSVSERFPSHSPVNGQPANFMPLVNLECDVGVAKSVLDSLPPGPSSSALTLSGALAIPGSCNRYLINAGRHDFDCSELACTEWDLLLENQSTSPITFVADCISCEDLKNWFTVSCSQGTLSSLHDTVTLTLSLSTKRQGIFSGYLLLGVPGRPMEQKVVRIEMVVAKPTPAAERVFVVESENTSFMKNSPLPELHMGDIFFGQYYNNRSFKISNLSRIPLEFVATSDLPADSLSNVYFSLSCTTLKMFTSLTLQPESSTTVYVHFHPQLSEGLKSTHTVVEHFDFLINVNCKVIKDSQASIRFFATCFQPQIMMSSLEVVFFGSPSITDPVIMPPFYQITAENCFPTPLVIDARHHSNFFSIEMAENTVRDRGDSLILTVTPDSVRLKSLDNQAYVEEHFVVYNADTLCEKYVVALRYTTSSTSLFYIAPGSKLGYAFNRLEENISVFLPKFDTVFSNLLCCVSKPSGNITLELKMPEYQTLLADYFYIIDELIFYGMKGHVGHFVFSLADLFFRCIMKHKLFKIDMFGHDFVDQHSSDLLLQMLENWRRRIRYFINHFATASTLHVKEMLNSL